MTSSPLTKEVTAKKDKMPYATPMFMKGYRYQCQYCGGADTHFEYLHHSFGLLSCDTHVDLAKRDARAWCAGEGLVKWSDAIDDPLFVETGLLTWGEAGPEMGDIKVRRSSGLVEEGWKLHTPSTQWTESNYVCRSKTSGRWSMQAIQKYTDVTRGLLIEDLKLTVPEAKWDLVDAFLARLEAGFYKAEQEAPVAQVEPTVSDDITRLLDAHGQQRRPAAEAAQAELAQAKAAYGLLCADTLGDMLARSAEQQEVRRGLESAALKRMERAAAVANAPLFW